MLELITADQNWPFAVALLVMLGIALLEGLASLLGAGVSSFLDSLLPDSDIDVNASASIDGSEVPSASALSRFLGWLRVGKVPVLVLLVIFLTGFGLIGLLIQSISNSLFNLYLPSLVASSIAFFLSLPIVRVLGGGIGAIMPKDETDAVSEDSLLGRIATITLGTSSYGNAAQAKVKDQHGLTHYIMVEPDNLEETFSATQSVLLIKKEGSLFKAIRNENQSLVDN